eukprot:4152831-Pleurochrysis_carterae.AAC.4
MAAPTSTHTAGAPVNGAVRKESAASLAQAATVPAAAARCALSLPRARSRARRCHQQLRGSTRVAQLPVAARRRSRHCGREHPRRALAAPVAACRDGSAHSAAVGAANRRGSPASTAYTRGARRVARRVADWQFACAGRAVQTLNSGAILQAECA